MLHHSHRNQPEQQSSGSMQGWGKIYDHLIALLTLGQEPKIRQATLALANIRPGESILEVGCGTGTLALAARRAAGAGSWVAGIDVASDMIEISRQKAARAGLDVTFQVGQIEAIPYPDATFDLVLSSLMLHHVRSDEAKRQGIQEIFRVLKPGGRLLIVDIRPPENRVLVGLLRLFAEKEMLTQRVEEFLPMLREAGFTQVETGRTKSIFLAYLRGNQPELQNG